MSESLIRAGWTHDKLKWIKNDGSGNTEHVAKSRNETSGVDTKESRYQFMKPAASNTS